MIRTAGNMEEARLMLTEHPEGVILDVREEEEYVTGHLENSVLFPVDSISAASAENILPDKSVPLLIYCRSGRRSAAAAEKLEALGFREIYDLGGLAGWPYGLVTW